MNKAASCPEKAASCPEKAASRPEKAASCPVELTVEAVLGAQAGRRLVRETVLVARPPPML